MAEHCRSVLCWFILSRLQCSVFCRYLWFKQLLTHWCNTCLSYHNLWRVPFVRCLLKSKIRNYSGGGEGKGKKKKKEPSRVAKTGNRKGHLLFWKLWGIVLGLCEWCIACALLLFPSNIWLWPVLLMEWGFCSLALWTLSFHQDHSTLLVQLQWREAEVSATWVSTSFGKESIQPVKETDNLRERQKPWPRPMFTPKGSGCWPISLSKPAPCTCSWCLSPSQTQGMGDQRGNGKQYLTCL